MLDNKLGINNSTDLAREEERISKKKAVELFENNILDILEVGKFSTLQTIHKYLFEDIYDFAGKLRNVNIAKWKLSLCTDYLYRRSVKKYR